MRKLLLSVHRAGFSPDAPMNDTRDLSDFILGVRTNAWGCDGFLLGVADLFGVPIIVDSIKFDSDERCMAQITWPTAAATPQIP